MSGCENNLNVNPEIDPNQTPIVMTPTPAITDFNYPLAEVQLVVSVPANTPDDEPIYLSIVDEVTGIALNPQLYPMDPIQTDEERTSKEYFISLPATAGSVMKYRYSRGSDSVVLPEHTITGEPVRYRATYIPGPLVINDVVSRWTDTQFEGESGELLGQVTDSTNNSPLSNILVFAGGVQTQTDQDGFFAIKNLPPGIHNIVLFSKDGAYQVFQQGAKIEANAPTMAPIMLSPSNFVDVTFRVSLPEGTPPIVPVRMAGNLLQLGNTFTTLSGGMSGDVESMPIMVHGEDGIASLSISLPVGAYISYKYTLGDGFWNAEHTLNGDMRIRNFIVPENDSQINDQIDKWDSDSEDRITFDVQAPETKNSGDYVSIQFNPVFGWTEPIPMWSLGNNRWAYILFSPLNLPGNLTYRYCNNGECGIQDDIATPGVYGPGRPISLDELPKIQSDIIEAWTNMPSQ